MHFLFDHKLHAGALFLIALTALIAYSNSFAVPFVYDDIGNIVQNESLASFDFSDWRSYSGMRSLPGATFALQVRLGLNEPWHYHAGNLAIHIANAWLVYWLCLLLGSAVPATAVLPRVLSRWAPHRPHSSSASSAPSGTEPLGIPFGAGAFPASHPHANDHAGRGPFLSYLSALFAALVFVAHPIATEAVTYIVQRHVSLTALFYLLSVVTYVWWRSGKSMGWAGVSLVAAVAAMHSKQISVTLPVAILLAEIFFFARQTKRWWVYSLPWLILLVYLPWRMFGLPDFVPVENPAPAVALDAAGSVEESLAAAAGGEALTHTDYLLTQAGVLLKYLQLLTFPFRQSVDHDYAALTSPYNFIVLAAAAVTLWLLILAWFLRRRSPLISFGILWFYLTLAPESTVIPLLEAMAEYRLYLPLVGFALAGGGLGQLLYTALPGVLLRLQNSSAWREADQVLGQTLLGVMVVAVAALTFLTWQRNFVWQSAETLWRDAVVKAPEKARPHNNLGVLLLQKGELSEAAEEFETAVRLNDKYAHAYNNLGTTRAKQGDATGAATAYARALELDPSLTAVAINLGTIRLTMGQLEEAAAVLEATVRRDATSARAYTVLGAVYLQQGKFADARAQFEAALAIDPSFPSARNNLQYLDELEGG